MQHPRGFASDNNASVHPEILAALQRANQGHALAYGADAVTEHALELFQRHFGPRASAHLVFNGTGANVLSLATLTRPFHAVLCTSTAHINVDECGAPEHFTGCKLIDIPTADGKLTVADVEPHLHVLGNEHHAQPRVISVTQSTELGTVYTPDELRTLTDFAHRHGMLVHMDGARIANAAASLAVPLRAITTDVGVDVLSFGGTKNGMMLGEAVVFLTPGLDENFRFIRKQGMQLCSKSRYLAAQFVAMLDGDLWLRNATHANRMARLLETEVRSISGVTITQRVEANAVFACIPSDAIEPLQQEYFFYVWDPARSEVRWMCSHDTTEDDVRGFAAAIRRVLG